MPIEDIDYLKNNSTKQRYLFLVNSSDRDRSVNPTPSEYVVNFTMPFQNVVGLTVVDSSIPRTMYNIDIYNNTFVYCVYNPSITPLDSLSSSNYSHVNVEPGDYTIETLIVAINNTLQGTIPITAVSLSNPPEIKNKIKFHCPYPFIIDMSLSTIAETLGFDLYIDPAESLKPIYNQRYTAINYPNNYKGYGSVNIPPGNSNVSYYTNDIFTGPVGVVRKETIAIPNKLAQAFRVTTSGYLTNIQVALANTTGIISNTNIASWQLWNNNATSNIPNNFIGISNIIETTYIDGGYSQSTLSLNTSNTFLTEGIYWILFESSDPTMQIYYNDVIQNQNANNLTNTYPGANPMLISGDNGTTWTSLDDTVNGIYFQASIIVTTQEDYNVLVAPGIYNLLGEKYITLRCPEIEQNSFRYLAYSKYFMGLAKFKLDTVGYNSEIIDYNDTLHREFHPIGKLSRLSLRFETSAGNIYDFKGVNHNITFAIYYYEPVQKERFQNSILNPNYQGNFVNYMYRQQEQEEESDDQEFDYDRDNLENYKEMENRYNPENIQRIDNEIKYQSLSYGSRGGQGGRWGESEYGYQEEDGTEGTEGTDGEGTEGNNGEVTR